MILPFPDPCEPEPRRRPPEATPIPAPTLPAADLEALRRLDRDMAAVRAEAAVRPRLRVIGWRAQTSTLFLRGWQ